MINDMILGAGVLILTCVPVCSVVRIVAVPGYHVLRIVES